MLSVSVLSVPRCAAATLLLLLLRLIVTVGDGLAPAVDSVVVTPRKTVEPRFNQRKKCVETDGALHTATKPDCLCPRQFGACFTAGAATAGYFLLWWAPQIHLPKYRKIGKAFELLLADLRHAITSH